MNKKLAIVGAGGHGLVIGDMAHELGWSKIDYFDSDSNKKIPPEIGHIVGSDQLLIDNIHQYEGVIIGIGDNLIRWRWHQELKNLGANIVSIISKDAIVSKYCYIGTGTVIMPGVVININTKIGESCIVNTGAKVDHDCLLGNGVHVSPGVTLSGAVTIGDISWVGSGASVKNNIKIGAHVIAGVGAVVVEDVADEAIIIGNPARLKVINA